MAMFGKGGFGFQELFGAKKPFGQVPGMGQQPAMPQMAPGAMQPNMGAMTKKPKFFSKDGFAPVLLAGISDFIAREGGNDQNMVGDIMQQRQLPLLLQQRQEQEERQRMQKREDMQWEWANKPQERRVNDTVEDFNWYSKLDPKQRELYHQMKPTVAYRADGTPYTVNPMQLAPQGRPPTPGAVEDGHQFIGGDPANPANWKKVGGGVGNGTGGFR